MAGLPDFDNDGFPEIVVSAPRNELYYQTLTDGTGSCIADFPTRGEYHNCVATTVLSSIRIYPSADYSVAGAATNVGSVAAAQSLPSQNPGFGLGTCTTPRRGRGGTFEIRGGFEIFSEDPNDFLGGAEHAGDVNLDGVPDIICGAPFNNHPTGLVSTGAVYLIYGRRPVGDVRLTNLDVPQMRPPALRIRGETAGDQLGHVQLSALDLNGDRIDDIVFGSPDVDFGGVSAGVCGDTDGNGILDANDLDLALFNACRTNFGEEAFLDDLIGNRSCKAFDFDFDRDIDDDDRDVFDCLVAGFDGCCPVNNGFVGVIFGNINLDGDRTLSQLATNDLPGIKFFGATAGDRAGADVVSAGDFNRDGFGDLLIAAPGVRFTDANNRDRMGVAYLIFGGTHLNGNRTFSLAQVGSAELPGIVLQTPFFAGRPNEAPIEHVGALGDINGDGFDDISLGIPRADFLDGALPQNPNDPGTNPNIGRRPDDGNVYIIYGNNTGSNQ